MLDRQFVFILGAGASVKSGIPSGKTLAEKWLRELHTRECLDHQAKPLQAWVAGDALGIAGLSFDTAVMYYAQIFERRFRGDPHEGYAALEKAMEGKQPSLGYSLLAEIIQHTRHKVVVTTNFDNLVVDALAMHAHQSPLVVAHESLTGFIQPKLRRPLVAKIHRDLFYAPKNDVLGVSKMEDGWKKALRKLFQHFTPIVVGYGGNDGSLMDLLESLELGEISGQMIWCYRDGSAPPEKAHSFMLKHNGVQVKIQGFDEFMLLLAAKLVDKFDVAEIASRTERLGKDRAVHYQTQATDLQKSSLSGSASQQKTGQVLIDSVQAGKSWWAWRMQASAESDINKRDEIYRKGLAQFPKNAGLAGSYANFLSDQRKDYETAEAQYKQALELDPSDATNMGNYAIFLTDQRKDYEAAEVLYKQALVLDPSDAINTANYASFLADQRKDYDAAEILYKKALQLDPSDADLIANFASLQLVKGDSASVQQVASMVLQVVGLADGQPTQALAEAHLYDCLQRELDSGSADAMLGRLKSLFHMGFERGTWDFSPVFDAVFPRIDASRVALYRAIGAAILDADQVQALEEFEVWRNIAASTPYAPC